MEDEDVGEFAAGDSGTPGFIEAETGSGGWREGRQRWRGAGATTRYRSGDEEADLARGGWYDGYSGNRLHEVREKRANPFGLFKMHGNVFGLNVKTVLDSYAAASTNCSPWVQGGDRLHVVRSGCSRDPAGGVVLWP